MFLSMPELLPFNRKGWKREGQGKKEGTIFCLRPGTRKFCFSGLTLHDFLVALNKSSLQLFFAYLSLLVLLLSVFMGCWFF